MPLLKDPEILPSVKSLSVFFTYPLLFTSVRISTFRNILLKSGPPANQQISYLSGLIKHGSHLYNRYGLFALYRGVDTYLVQATLRLAVRNSIKKIKQQKKRMFWKYALEFAIYPMTFAWTRIICHSIEDSSNFSAIDAIQEATNSTNDGVLTLWAGFAPFLIAVAYEDFNELLMNKLQMKYRDMDEIDLIVARLCLMAQTAVVTSPLYAISTQLRATALDPNISVTEVLGNSVNWKSLTFQIGLIGILCGVNFALIHQKHEQHRQEEQEEREERQ
jgi:hypothetical protein